MSLKEFSNGDVINISVLGRGSFGTVWKVKYNDELAVVKIMDLRDKKEEAQKFLKEARVLNSLKENENIVTFKGVNYQPSSIMLEFCCFDFKPLGGDQEIPSLDQFLDYVDRFQFKNLESFSIKIAKDITHGLSFLHSKGIVHRDLKPANVLVTNRHYSDLKDECLEKSMAQKPIICKLGDFGESRSQKLQTKTLIHSMTTHLRRGTLSFMAPEQMSGKSKIIKASQADLFNIDKWQLGMSLFCLLNPNLKGPFEIEFQRMVSVDFSDFESYISSFLNNERLPQFSSDYNLQREIYWDKIKTEFFELVKLNPSDRKSLNSVLTF